ncbi:DNA replication complex GINS family protein [Methanothermobacter sp. KEPCO-1]|uniref:DNA replication complex GINS family protein n=1 Tax=Methanothermobacter sp. KEPCO-1 TaxID=2603820 RepID=UPI0011CB581A|nr:DNA replication complex GINS family protein [Methanothermobacter sp. KEPCO-1]QEF94571.1 DNA replication complex GINS family protein [Methanothermobacter sp. KEPCO-1]
MDEFFQKLRRIQKKERTESGLARVGDDFYERVHSYLEDLLEAVGNDPFAKEHYLIRDTQRIATEICERREHKITDSAVMNVQRSYHLFNGKPQFDLQDTTPLNMTPEEEELYFSLIETLREFREKIIPSIELDKEKEKPRAEPEVIQKPKKKDSQPSENEIRANALDDRGGIETVLIFEEVPARIMGVDEKIYGPFRPQDIVTLPSLNADVFINARKGRRIRYS